MAAQRGHRDPHVGEQRQPGQDLVQFLVAVDVEDAVVGVLADHAPDVAPLAAALQLLRVRLLARLDVIGDVGRQVGGDLDVHSYLEKHGQAPLLELAWVALARLTVRVARSRRKNCTRSSSRVMPRPGPSGTVRWKLLESSGSENGRAWGRERVWKEV